MGVDKVMGPAGDMIEQLRRALSKSDERIAELEAELAAAKHRKATLTNPREAIPLPTRQLIDALERERIRLDRLCTQLREQLNRARELAGDMEMHPIECDINASGTNCDCGWAATLAPQPTKEGAGG